MATQAALTDGRTVVCWSCSSEFDPVPAAWCRHDARLPNKTCPRCGECLCHAGEKLKQEFWKQAPTELLDELELLARRSDSIGDRLVESGKLSVGQLVTALRARAHWPPDAGLEDVLVDLSLVTRDDVDAALADSHERPLADTHGEPYGPPAIEAGGEGPQPLLRYILALAAHKRATEVHLEPRADGVGIRIRIDGVGFRLDPLPEAVARGFMLHVLETFNLHPALGVRPQHGRCRLQLPAGEFDLVAHALPTLHGTSITIRLIERATFIKDFAGLGLDRDDRMRLVSALRRSSGLVVIAAPLLEGGNTTAYSVMDFLVRVRREVISIESPVLWEVEGARQVDLVHPSHTFDALRAVVVARPDVAFVFSLPDAASALLATQLAASMVVVCKVAASSATQALTTLVDMGVPRHLLAAHVTAVAAQRLVRRICRICRREASAPSGPVLAEAGISSSEAAELSFWRGRGCPTCNRVGYRGRQAFFELLTATPELAAGLAQGREPQEVETLARAGGMRPLRARAQEAVARGVTTFEEYESLRL